MYSHERAWISNLLSRLLHEFLDLTPAIKLTIFFCKVNIFLLFNELPPKNYTILHCRVKMAKYTDLSVSVLLTCNIDLTA
jgi:hypothetical protein